MKRNRLFKLVGAIFLAAVIAIPFAAGCAAPAPAPAPAPEVLKWRFHTLQNETYVGGAMYQKFAELVKEKTNGKMEVEIFYSGTLGYKGPEMQDVIGQGLVELSEWQPMVTAGAETEWWSIGDFGFAIPNPEAGAEAGKRLLPLFKQYVPDDITLVDAGNLDQPITMGLWTDREIKTFDDLKGLKVRVYFPLMREYVFKPLGMEALWIPSAECYVALQTGLIDGVLRTLTGGLSGKYYELVKYYYAFQPMDFAGGVTGIMGNTEMINALPGDVREGLMDAGDTWVKWVQADLYPNWSDYTPDSYGGEASPDEIRAILEEKGLKMYKIPELWERAEAFALSGLEEWAAETGPAAQAAANAVLEARAMYPGINPRFESFEAWHIS